MSTIAETMLSFDPVDFIKRSFSYATTPTVTTSSAQPDNNGITSGSCMKANEFPYKLGPFGISQSDLLPSHFSFIICHENATGCYQIDPRQFKFDQQNKHHTKFETLIEFIRHMNASKQMDIDSYGILGNVSPLHMVTLHSASKRASNIPLNAVYFAWSYPSILPKKMLANMAKTNKSLTAKWLSDANIILLTVGGYMYFDEHKKLLQINTLTPAIDGGLQFSKPRKWDNRFTMALHKSGRFQEITIASLSEKGARYFCWIFPMEAIRNEKFEERIFTKHGGFVYLFHEPGDLTDENAVKMDRYFEVLDGNEFNAANRKQQLLLKQGVIKGVDCKSWRLTCIEYKKKELESLKSQLHDLYVDEQDEEDSMESKEEHLNDTDVELDDKSKSKSMMGWDGGRVDEWLNEVEMSELRVPFHRHKITGSTLMDNGNENVYAAIIGKLSRAELESLVMKQFSVRLNELKEQRLRGDKELLLRNKIDELQDEIEAIQDSKVCVICYKNDKNILMKPCNHVCCCNVCIAVLTKCPLCDRTIVSTEKIFN